MPSGGQISLDEENGREREKEKRCKKELTTNRARVIRKWRVVAHRRARK